MEAEVGEVVGPCAEVAWLCRACVRVCRFRGWVHFFQFSLCFMCAVVGRVSQRN